MKLDQAGIEFIARWEGLKLKAYQCSAGVWTIGIGSTRFPDGVPVKMGDTLASEDEAYDLFRDTVNKYENAVNKLVTIALDQNQFNALVSFTYNVGIGALQSSTLLKRINDKASSEEIKTQWRRWNKAGGQIVKGLSNRREAELELYFRGNDGQDNRVET